MAWIGYSIFVPRSFRPSDPVVSTAGQITSRGVELRKFLPVVYMNLDRHGYTACIVRSQPTRQESEDCIHAHVASLDRMKGRWTDIQIGFDTRVPGGRIEIWANDRLVERAEGFHRRRAPQYHFKYGIYRSNISRYPGALPTQVLLFDEVRFGQSRAAVRVDEANPVN